MRRMTKVPKPMTNPKIFTGAIIPVKIFGLVVGFGTLIILLMSYTLVPAILMLIPEKHLLNIAGTSAKEQDESVSWLSRLGTFCVEKTKPILFAGFLLFSVAVAGLIQIP